MGIFRFKQFSVKDDVSAMKIGTDAVLLGALMTLSSEERYLLDIGTGTGIISLMAAQRLSSIKTHRDSLIQGTEVVDTACSGGFSPLQNFQIEAIDIDAGAAAEAAENFSISKWNTNLRSIHSSLEDFLSQTASSFASDTVHKYDVIFSNPPYFDLSLQSPDSRRATARNSDVGLSYREIIDFAAKYLSPGGHLSFVLPATAENDLLSYAGTCGLHLFRIVKVSSVARKSPTRIIAEFSFSQKDFPEELMLTINGENGYSSQYKEFVKDFYLYL